MKKREIIHLIAYCVYGLIEVTALIFCLVAIYFVLCLLAG